MKYEVIIKATIIKRFHIKAENSTEATAAATDLWSHHGLLNPAEASLEICAIPLQSLANKFKTNTK